MSGATEANPSHRVVLVGASNLTRGIATITRVSYSIWGPCSFHAAIGHGRSYGGYSRMLGRGLPGILDCGLWKNLSATCGEVAALVSDIGNDILYDAPVDQIAVWVEETLDRLQRTGARVVMTELPLSSVRTLSPRRFLLFRSILFPRSRLKLKDVLKSGEKLNESVHELATSRAIPVVPQPLDWFGLDPIHIRRSAFQDAWSQILSHWGRPIAPGHQSGLVTWLYLRTRAPEQRYHFGRSTGRAQPSGKLFDSCPLYFF